MKREILNQKIDDLKYRIHLDNIGIEKAKYNIDFHTELNLDDKKFNQYKENYDYYSNKLKKDTATLNAITNSLTSLENGTSDTMLFKCTFPYEKVNRISSYQTEITIDEKAVGLFANGVDYNDMLACLENKDIYDIKSNYKYNLKDEDLNNKEVTVEVYDGVVPETIDEPIIVKYRTNDYKGLIASSKISLCYPSSGAYYKDLNGETYMPGVPTFDDISKLQDDYTHKYEKYNKLKYIEGVVKDKMTNTVDEMSDKIEGWIKKGEN